MTFSGETPELYGALAVQYLLGMKARMSNFGCADVNDWKLRLCGDRYQRLIEPGSFESIVGALAANAQLLSLRREKLKSQSYYYRVVMVLKVDRNALDLFHNGRCGYRAQYYLDLEIGERANAYAVGVLWARVKEVVPSSPKKTCPWNWVEASLTHEAAKVWVHQGEWLRHSRKSERNLQVDRWIRGLMARDPKQRKKARWAMLTPSDEKRLDIKGGFITKDGKPWTSSLKRHRSKEISCHGFT